jgi:argininosuccinate lyase
VHSFIEATLIERIGDDGRRLHTGRSRNDQTATALRLFVRETLWHTTSLLGDLVADLIGRAEQHTETFLPGYTHLQRGQPVSLAHHLLAHAWALLADGERFMRAFKSAGQSPLGAGALAGTPHPIAPHRSAELLGFDQVYANSMFAVADRDYVVESSFACALLQVHLSRWAEEVVLFTSREFGFARLLDSVAKGSSIMPQKRNPEPAEILRGKAGRGIGNLTAHLVQLKGLPLTYNSDLQEDKEPLFDALDTAAGSLRVSRSLLAGLEFDREAMARALYGGYITATDLADALVVKGLPFRSAHEQTGNAVKAAESLEVELWELDLAELQKHCPDADASVLAALDPASAARNHNSFGGPAPERVVEQIELARARLGELSAFNREEPVPPIYRAFKDGVLCDEVLGVGASDLLKRRGPEDRA